MEQMLLVSDVAGLAKDFERLVAYESGLGVSKCDRDALQDLIAAGDEESSGAPSRRRRSMENSRSLESSHLNASARIKLLGLLDQWEEPSRRYQKANVSSQPLFNSRVSLLFTFMFPDA